MSMLHRRINKIDKLFTAIKNNEPEAKEKLYEYCQETDKVRKHLAELHNNLLKEEELAKKVMQNIGIISIDKPGDLVDYLDALRNVRTAKDNL